MAAVHGRCQVVAIICMESSRTGVLRVLCCLLSGTCSIFLTGRLRLSSCSLASWRMDIGDCIHILLRRRGYATPIVTVQISKNFSVTKNSNVAANTAYNVFSMVVLVSCPRSHF